MNISASIRRFIRTVTSSIAFYPSLLAVLFLIFSFTMVSIEYKPFMEPVKELLDNVLVKSAASARLVLGTLVGSLISLMVFSFSMVMVVLSQAGSALSPRVIPALVGKKYHQIVLGVYLGAIIYSLIVIMNIRETEALTRIPSLGILIAVILGIFCLGMFIYFIDSISRSIQVDTILQEIFRDTRHKMQTVESEEGDYEYPDTSDWCEILTHDTGYLKQVHIPTLRSIAEKEGLKIDIINNPGFFLVANYPFIRVSKEVTEEVADKIRGACIFYTEEHVGDHYLFGFKQISEIAVKALSPGINDPGTAVKAIDLLSILFIQRMNLTEKNAEVNEDGEPIIYLPHVSFDDLLYFNLIPIRKYGETDASVMLNLLECLKNLIYADSHRHKYERVLMKYVGDLHERIKCNEFSTLDHQQFNLMIRKINRRLKFSDHVQEF